MPNQFGAKSQPQKNESASKYIPPYNKQPDYRTGPQMLKPWQKQSDMPSIGSGFSDILKAMKKQKIAGISGKEPVKKEPVKKEQIQPKTGGEPFKRVVPAAASPKPSGKPFLKRGEIRSELRKDAWGIPLKEKEKIIPKKFGSFITKTEMKKSERLLHGQYLKSGQSLKQRSITQKEERALKEMEKELK